MIRGDPYLRLEQNSKMFNMYILQFLKYGITNIAYKLGLSWAMVLYRLIVFCLIYSSILKLFDHPSTPFVVVVIRILGLLRLLQKAN